jgi:hypothetical protein
MQQYTVYQTDSKSFDLNIPCQISGPVRIQGALKIAPSYPNISNSWQRYLTDLNSMRYGGYPDYRPLTGPVSYVTGAIDATNWFGLTMYLGVSATPLVYDPANGDWVQPSDVSTYQIFPGGPVYTVPEVSNKIQSVTLGPDPITNPLGIYYCKSSMSISNDVTIRGSLYCKNKLTIDGTNVHFEPVEMPGLFGTGASVRLPAIVCETLNVKSTTFTGSIKGLVAAFTYISFDPASELQTFSITGRIITDQFYVYDREPWNVQDWKKDYRNFTKFWPPLPYFPVYMGSLGRNPQPLLTIKPDTTSITYHWLTSGSPIFMANPSDGAIRWEVIKWSENP